MKNMFFVLFLFAASLMQFVQEEEDFDHFWDSYLALSKLHKNKK